MRQSKLFGKTTKTVSKDLKTPSHKFLMQGGFIQESVAGRYYFLPLGMKVRDKIIRIIEEEMDKAGAEKMITPVLHPLELWKETSRTETAGFELMTLEDRRGSGFALGGTAEEMMVDVVRKYNISYKDLPFHIYQFSQKFRDELRARGGLLRVREFLMKDGYSFHADEEDFKKEYKKMWDVYLKIFQRLGLKALPVESDNGYIGGDYCHEFVVESEVGESRFLTTADGKYAAHEDVAVFQKENKNVDEKEEEIKEVDAERGRTMEDGTKFHDLPLWQQIKDVMFVDDKGKFILAVIRGDLDVNETKLLNIVDANELRAATDEEVRELGSEPGFISPVGISEKVTIVVDDSLRTVKNAYGGANKKNKDLVNTNIDRDFKPNIEGDIAMAQEGFFSQDGEKLIEGKGIEVGNIFQLGEHYSSRMNATFTDEKGKEKFYYMGCYGIGIGRNMATIVEKYHDERGVVWPEAVAPFRVHIVELSSDDKKVKEEAEGLYEDLVNSGVEVLYDDREGLAAGEKFADADLIGCPYRVVVSAKTVEQNKFELKKRSEDESEMVSKDELIEKLK